MKRILLRSSVFCLLALSSFCGLGQSAQNITAVFTNGNATITYDLIGFKAKELYLVDLYASYNNFITPLRLVNGDVGRSIREGKGKKIEWRASEEARNYTGSITFQIKIALLFQPLEFVNPIGGSIRRGHTTTGE